MLTFDCKKNCENIEFLCVLPLRQRYQPKHSLKHSYLLCFTMMRSEWCGLAYMKTSEQKQNTISVWSQNQSKFHDLIVCDTYNQP